MMNKTRQTFSLKAYPYSFSFLFADTTTVIEKATKANAMVAKSAALEKWSRLLPASVMMS